MTGEVAVTQLDHTPVTAHPMVLIELASGSYGSTRAQPTQNVMRTRGLELLEAHIRSFDPDAPTARERVEAALGAPFTERLLQILLSSAVGGTPSHPPQSST